MHTPNSSDAQFCIDTLHEHLITNTQGRKLISEFFSPEQPAEPVEIAWSVIEDYLRNNDNDTIGLTIITDDAKKDNNLNFRIENVDITGTQHQFSLLMFKGLARVVTPHKLMFSKGLSAENTSETGIIIQVLNTQNVTLLTLYICKKRP